MAVGWWLYAQQIAPLQRQETGTRAAIADLRGRINAARSSLTAIDDLQQQTGNLPARLQEIHGDISADSALAWLPQRVKGHFARFGLPIGATHMVSMQDEPELPGYRRSHWTVGLPIEGGNRKIGALLLAVEGLENEERFVRVIDCVIQPVQEDSSQHKVSMKLLALVRE
jgi:hypothetical protein